MRIAHVSHITHLMLLGRYMKYSEQRLTQSITEMCTQQISDLAKRCARVKLIIIISYPYIVLHYLQNAFV